MTDAITAEEYREEVADTATMLVEGAKEAVERGDYDDTYQAIMDLAHEECEYHNWFARSYYDGGLYGSIVEHREADTGRYSDVMGLIEGSDPDQILKRLAYVCFEADVIDRASNMADHDDLPEDDA